MSLHPRDREMSCEASSLGGADVCRVLGNSRREAIKTTDGEYQRAISDDVDPWAKTRTRRRQRHAIEDVNHFFGMSLAQESQRDVPVLGRDEANPTPILAGQRSEL